MDQAKRLCETQVMKKTKTKKTENPKVFVPHFMFSDTGHTRINVWVEWLPCSEHSTIRARLCIPCADKKQICAVVCRVSSPLCFRVSRLTMYHVFACRSYLNTSVCCFLWVKAGGGAWGGLSGETVSNLILWSLKSQTKSWTFWCYHPLPLCVHAWQWS